MDTQSLFTLEGRTALVTGGSCGIGKMIAVALSVRVPGLYLKSKQRCARQLLESWAPTVLPCRKIFHREGCKVYATMAEHEDSIDVLVNNAGAAWGNLSNRTLKKAGIKS